MSVPHSVVIRLQEPAVVDDILSLRNQIGRLSEARGEISLVYGPEEVGTLGALLEAIQVTLVPGGIATALTTSIVTWMRNRRSSISVKLTKPDGSQISLDASKIRLAKPDEVKEIIDKVAAELHDVSREQR